MNTTGTVPYQAFPGEEDTHKGIRQVEPEYAALLREAQKRVEEHSNIAADEEEQWEDLARRARADWLEENPF